MGNELTEKIDFLIRDFMDEVKIPGIAVGVIEKNRIAYAKGFGVLSVETNALITENTFFHMASVSKLFVAIGIMQLAEQEKVCLEDTVVKHLPYFKIKGDAYSTITIREMLSHISGMPDIYDYEWDKPQYDEEALERHVKKAAELELIEGQRGKFRYSNLAFEILGDLISKVSGMPFESYIKKNILDLIGMKESTFLNIEVNKELLAAPHCLDLKNGYRAKVSEVFPYNRRHAPSSTLCSNLVEMFKWSKVNLNKGTIDGVRILQEKSYLELFRPAAPTGRAGYNSQIGLGWFLGDYKGNKVASHSGMDTGFQSNFVILPEKEIGLVWMTNNDFAPMKVLTEGLLDIVLDRGEQEVRHSLATTLVKAMIEDGIQIAADRYDFIKNHYKNRYYIEEYEFNGLAYRLLGENRISQAIAILEIAIKELPAAANLYDSLGEMYLKNNNILMAIENYETAVELNPQNKKAVKILQELRS